MSKIIYQDLILKYLKKYPNYLSLRDLARKIIDGEKLSISDKQLGTHISTVLKIMGKSTKINANKISPQDMDQLKHITRDKVNITKTGNGIEIELLTSKTIQTPEELLKHCKIDPELWEVERHVINKWDVTSWKAGRAQVAQNFQVKLWIKPIKERVEIVNFMDNRMDHLKKFAPIYPKITYVKESRKRLLEINIFDLHFGKLCWEGETGSNYDTKIAEKRFTDAINQLLSYASAFKIDRIVFPIGNDFFNSDNMRNTTTAGTFQDEDLRWQKTFDKGVDLIIKGIDMCQQIAPVDVIIVPGNHDFERSFYLGKALECQYHKCPNVEINNSATPRKYYEYGQCLIGYTHGNNEKHANLPNIMASEVKEAWARTTYREFHLGHLHHKKEIKWMSTEEFTGMTVRMMRSLSGDDAWHFQKGYTGSVKAAEGFVWDKETGLIGQFSTNLNHA